ncbi:MAG TPA: AMP-binding protein [Candidatus Brocadiaceae bacterium]
MAAYLGALQGRHPVMLVSEGRQYQLESIIEKYQPDFIYSKRGDTWNLTHHSAGGVFHEQLGLLLSTSGSTGSSKFVRLSYRNIQSNAESIVSYLGINDTHCAVTALPFHYSYGLSVVNTHLMMGATLLLTDVSLTEPEFWELFKINNVTSLSCIPHSFDLLDKIGFEDMELPSLKYITQAGGRLAPDRVLKYAGIAKRNNWTFFVMYGQTEATARMSYVPPHILENYPECIGVPIPGGEFKIIDEKGVRILEADMPGEIVYTGPNVMMGYSSNRNDLVNGAEITELKTGDLACRNNDGLYYIVGRKTRFIKIFGLRINLEDVEDQLGKRGIRAVCTGNDEKLVIATLEVNMVDSIKEMIGDWSKLPRHVIYVLEIEAYPLLASGKIDYVSIMKILEVPNNNARDKSLLQKIQSITDGIKCIFKRPSSGALADNGSDTYPIRKAFMKALGKSEVKPENTFVGLGGDSLSYVHVFMSIEKILGYVPKNWQNIPVGELEQLEVRKNVSTAYVETATLLRALSIMLIVSTHFKLFGQFRIEGGTIVLMAVAGFHFAKFQVCAINTLSSFRPIMTVIIRLLTPCIVLLFLKQSVKGHYSLSEILFFSNFINPFSEGLWFIEVLLQIYLILLAVFSFKKIRALLRTNLYLFGLIMLGVSVLSYYLVSSIWDTRHLLPFVPHRWFWLFALGWCVFFGDTVPKKIINTLLLFLLVFTLYDITSKPIWISISISGIMPLIWIDRIALIRPLNKIITIIGASSLYIYVSHGFCKVLFKALVQVDSKLLDTTVGIVGGIVFWFLADALFGYIGRKKWKLSSF